jgi:predicted dehydrogenase/nucleoside-diphosphate-sugar epimerase
MSMQRTGNTILRAGLVGAGYISEYHVAALRRAAVEIVGICDVDAARCQAAADKAGVKPFASMAELAAAGASVMHVLTPPHTHAALALQALDLGCHVLVEKPLAQEVDDCDRLERRAAETGLKVCVNHSLLYDPQVRKAVDIARSGKLGTIVSVDILRSSLYPPFAGGALPPQYRAAGYPFRDIGVHCLYLLEALLGPIENVRADWKSLGGDPNLAFDEWRAQVRCKGGLGQFQLSWNVRPLQSQIIIQGTKAVMRVDLFLMFKALRKSGPLPKAAERIVNAMTDSLQPLVDVPRGVWGFLRKKVLPYHGLQDLVKDFYRSIADGTDVPVSVSDAKRVVRWTEQVARDAEADYAARIQPFQLSDEVPVLVTGASGALGGEVVKRLRAEGRRVRVLVRRPPEVVPDGVEVALGDLGDPSAVDRAVRGAKTVIHAGAAMKGGWVEHETGTVRGTQHVLDACLKHRVQKLVHVSSMSVIDWAGSANDAPVDENTPFEPRAEERGSYTRAKLEAEKLVTAFARRHGFATVILRPGQIFGGKIPLLTPAVARKAGKRWLVLGGGDVRLPLVYMDDVVDAILLAADGPLRNGEVIQLVDDYTPTQDELLAQVLGPRAKTLHLPRPILFGLGKFSEFPLGLLKRQSPVAAYRLKSALARRTFQSVNAELLGWKPRVGAREGIRRVTSPTTNTSGAEAAAVPPSGAFPARPAVRAG